MSDWYQCTTLSFSTSIQLDLIHIFNLQPQAPSVGTSRVESAFVCYCGALEKSYLLQTKMIFFFFFWYNAGEKVTLV